MTNKEAKEEGVFTLEDWAKAPIVSFDLREHYDTVIKAKVDELAAMCEACGLPYFMQFSVSMDETSGGTTMSSGCEDIGRMSPEYLAHRMLTPFGSDARDKVEALMRACRAKYHGDVQEEEVGLDGLSELFQRLMAP